MGEGLNGSMHQRPVAENTCHAFSSQVVPSPMQAPYIAVQAICGAPERRVIRQPAIRLNMDGLFVGSRMRVGEDGRRPCR